MFEKFVFQVNVYSEILKMSCFLSNFDRFGGDFGRYLISVVTNGPKLLVLVNKFAFFTALECSLQIRNILALKRSNKKVRSLFRIHMADEKIV